MQQVNVTQSKCIVRDAFASALQKQHFSLISLIHSHKMSRGCSANSSHVFKKKKSPSILYVCLCVFAPLCAKESARKRVKEIHSESTCLQVVVSSFHTLRLLLHCDWMFCASIQVHTHRNTHLKDITHRCRIPP